MPYQFQFCVKILLFDFCCQDMVPTDHDLPFSRTFQGLLMYIFKEFSMTFLCSIKHPFAKNYQQWTFQI